MKSNIIKKFKAEAFRVRSIAVIKMGSSKSDIKKQFEVDRICKECKGTGKNKYGKECRECMGKGVANDLSHPRYTFGSGYRHVASDARRGKIRKVVDTGPHNLDQVSRSWNPWYAAGYEFGIRDHAEGKSDGKAAWVEFTGGLPSD